MAAEYSDSFENLTPETVMPEQFADLCRSNARDGYSRLWLAVLEDALRVISGHFSGNTSRRIVMEQAWAWIEDEAKHPGSFNFVCEALGIDPENLRAKLLELKAADNIPKFRRHRPVITGENKPLRGRYERKSA